MQPTQIPRKWPWGLELPVASCWWDSCSSDCLVRSACTWHMSCPSFRFESSPARHLCCAAEYGSRAASALPSWKQHGCRSFGWLGCVCSVCCSAEEWSSWPQVGTGPWNWQCQRGFQAPLASSDLTPGCTCASCGRSRWPKLLLQTSCFIFCRPTTRCSELHLPLNVHWSLDAFPGHAGSV